MTEAQGGDGRRRLVALAVLLLIAAPLVVVALVTSGGDESPATGLRIERSSVAGEGTPQLIVYVEDPAANVPATARKRPTVELQCLDGKGATLLRGIYPWPFTDTDQGTTDAHVHVNVPAGDEKKIVRCRLNGTEGPLTGRPTGE